MKNLYIIIFVLAIIAIMIGAFSFLRPQVPYGKTKDSSQETDKITRIEDVPGVTNIKKISDRSRTNITRSNISSRPRPTVTPKPLPYPRITINYSTSSVSSIRNDSAGANNTFIIVKLDIRNYGYRYFDAHPTKFRILVAGGGVSETELESIVSVNTGDMIDDIVPNNSRAKGDIVFKSDKKRTSVRKIIYLGDYTILYKQGIPSEIKKTTITSGTSGIDCDIVDCG